MAGGSEDPSIRDRETRSDAQDSLDTRSVSRFHFFRQVYTSIPGSRYRRFVDFVIILTLKI